MLKRCVLALCLLMLCASAALAAEESKKHFVVAHDGTWPPMEYIDGKMKLVGYSVDYIDAVAKEAGFTVRHKNVEWEGIFSGLAKGEYDIIASSVTITEDRKKLVDFSIPYYTVRQAVIMPKAATAVKLEDLSQKRVGTQLDTTGYYALGKIGGINRVSYDDVGLAMKDLSVGRLDAVVCDDPVATNFIRPDGVFAEQVKLAFIIPAAEPEQYGFAVAQGDTHTLELLNKGIAAVKEKGIEAELIKKWLR